MNDIKQVIVIRKDLKMRQGKACGQSAHASLKVILDQMNNINCGCFHKSKVLRIVKDSPLDLWINGTFTKIVVYVNSEQELLDIYYKAFEAKMICSLIQDVGKTEFKGVPTYTCCAIGPEYSEEIDKITGHLPLL